MCKILLAFALLTAPVAPTTCNKNCQLKQGDPLSIAYDWASTVKNPTAIVGFRLYVNGEVKASVPVAALKNGTVTFELPTGLDVVGAYTLTVSAYSSSSETQGTPISGRVK